MKAVSWCLPFWLTASWKGQLLGYIFLETPRELGFRTTFDVCGNTGCVCWGGVGDPYWMDSVVLTSPPVVIFEFLAWASSEMP